MFTSMFFYLFICLLIFGIGDVLGVATKAKVSALFVSLMLFLVGFMTGVLPPDIIKLAGLTDIGKWSLIFVVFSMGSSLNIKQLIAEWRTVAVAVLSMIVLIAGSVVLIPVIGYQETIVSIPIINGGIIANQIMTSAAMDKGFAMATALGTVLYAVQKFVGTPVASYFGLRAAKEALAEFRRTGVNPYAPKEEVHGGAAPKETFFEKHKKFYGPFASLTIAAFFSRLAFVIGKYTGLSATIWSLILGAVIGSTGLVPLKILDHAKSSGIFNVGVFAVLFLFFYILPLWKILGTRNLAMGVAVMQLLGFPATYLVANEIAIATGETEEERQVVNDAIMPKYLVGGFATVTTFSVITAGILEKFL